VVVEVLLAVKARTQVTVTAQLAEVLEAVVDNILLVDKLELLVFLDKDTLVGLDLAVVLVAAAVKVQLVLILMVQAVLVRLIQLVELLAVVAVVVQRIVQVAVAVVLEAVVILELVRVMEQVRLEVLILVAVVEVLVERMEVFPTEAQELLSSNTNINRSLEWHILLN
jgi:hypothetical protein